MHPAFIKTHPQYNRGVESRKKSELKIGEKGK